MLVMLSSFDAIVLNTLVCTASLVVAADHSIAHGVLPSTSTLQHQALSLAA
jgi:hypothetical protein